MKQFKWSKNRPTKGLSFPTSREGLSLTYIPQYNYVLMFGGISNGRLNDIMIYNITDQSWRTQETKGRQPAPRCYHAAFYDRTDLQSSNIKRKAIQCFSMAARETKAVHYQIFTSLIYKLLIGKGCSCWKFLRAGTITP
jgi:hypothetical protein